VTIVPSVARIVAVVGDLGALANDVVFIGGAIAPLLHTSSPLPRARPTKDVDGVLASYRYGDADQLHRSLRQRGFRHDTTHTAHVHRWIAPSGVLFDLVPAGDHTGGSGNEWDAEAIESAVEMTIDGVTFRHASAPAFIAMKLSAFHDRGGNDMRSSHDIEDVFALIASRESVVRDIDNATPAARDRIRSFATTLLATGLAEDIAAGHLNNAEDSALTLRITLRRIEDIAALGARAW
jgi:predicted nucleotidyltransferase